MDRQYVCNHGWNGGAQMMDVAAFGRYQVAIRRAPQQSKLLRWRTLWCCSPDRKPQIVIYIFAIPTEMENGKKAVTGARTLDRACIL